MNNITQKFTNAMLNAGVNPPTHLIADGKLHRFHVEGDRRGTLNGAYILHLIGKPAGWFQHFKTGITCKWTLSGKREPISADLQQQIDAARRQRAKEQAEAHQQTAAKASRIRDKATPITEPNQHSYLIRKCIKPHDSRLYRDALAIPLYDESGQIVNLQFIASNGTKRFLSGGRKKGCFHQIGTPTGTVLICEGFATGCSLHEQTGHYVIVAMDCGNLKPVAETMRRNWPNEKIIICGDNDESGVGQIAANDAALVIGGKVLIPPISGMDFNDFINAGGVVYG